MAAPVVTGTVALMLQANPNLTPNLIKALLQYTAQVYPGYSPLRQGAGFLNTLGAVRLAKFYAQPQRGDQMPIQKVWSRHIDLGQPQLRAASSSRPPTRGRTASSGAAPRRSGTDGDNIVWGTAADGDNIVWGTANDGDNIVWGTADRRRQHRLGHRDRRRQHRLGHRLRRRRLRQHRVGHRRDGDNIVWGTANDGDNIVWGTATDGDNIVWGTNADTDVTWGSDADDAVTFSDDVIEPLPSLDLEFGDLVPLVPVTPDASAQRNRFDRRLTMEKMPYRPELDGRDVRFDAPAVLPPVAQAVSTDWRDSLPMLAGATVTLRELRASDAPSLFALLTTEEVSRFISPPPNTVEGFEQFIAWTLRQRSVGSYACFAVTHRRDRHGDRDLPAAAAGARLRHGRVGIRARIGVLGHRRIPGRS